MRGRILIGPSTFAALDKTPLALLEQENFEIVANPYGRKLTKAELIALLPGVCGLIAGLEIIDREVLNHSTLKVVSRCGSGISNVDLQVAHELGITVCSTPDGPTRAVSELTVGMVFSLIRLVPEMNTSLHQGIWNKQTGYELSGKTVAVVGLGRIGKKVAEFLNYFGVRVLGVDPLATQDVPPFITRVPLATALSEADIITLHASGEEEILGYKELERVKRGVFILNPSRGHLVNEQALIAALEDGRVRGAWMDAFAYEPYAGPLARFPQVMLTPHISSYTLECRKKMETEAAANLLSALKAHL